jgi:hypothetical protein
MEPKNDNTIEVNAVSSMFEEYKDRDLLACFDVWQARTSSCFWLVDASGIKKPRER